MSSEEMFSSPQVNSIQVVTEDLVSNFWKLDSVPEASLLTSKERACEDYFIGKLMLEMRMDDMWCDYYFPHSPTTI
ncbi:hypothetical protein TNIN_401651 [Trichonephila inaurata madagascariensis]|uniref:Uncharacterized protein n=1 Tax=Trichonephila inaurata madagascariensis TaxID=2747483 RepID=A0A8X7CS45_9ARAC|nr:hypothetical protein TNIN_401651 [Trichonephila inaurata madagascariensis]